MKIILSPAKKMNVDEEKLEYSGMPVFLDKTKMILSWLQSRSYEELKSLWGCGDKIAEQNAARLKDMDIEHGSTPAVIAYEGLAYQYMAPSVFEKSQIDYIQDHLRILSAFYGVLKPLDGVKPYRLEMQAKGKIENYKDLYDFWGDALYREVIDGSGVIVNLASKEYYKCIERYLKKSDRFITCSFVEEANGKLTTKGTYAKMARGEMVRFMAEKEIEDVADIKYFNRLGYVYRQDMSDENVYVFERKAMNGEV